MLFVHRPLLYLLAGFCCGIAAGGYLPTAPIIQIILLALFCLLLFWRTMRGRKSLFLPIVIFIALGLLASSGIPDPDQPPFEIQRLLESKNAVVMGTVTHTPQQGQNKTRIRLLLEGFKEGDDWRPLSGNMLLNVRQCQQAWPVGQRLIGRVRLRSVRNFNNPGGFNYRQYLANQRIWLSGYVRRDVDLVALDKPESSWAYLLHRVRIRSRAFLEAWLPSEHASLYRALLLGERFALTSELREILYSAGVGHLLAISGLHIGLVAGFAFLAFHFVMIRTPAIAGRWGARPGAALAAFPIALAYGSLTGMGLPALRATIMLGVFTLALVLQREKDLLNSLLLAASLILMLYPEALFTVSFQLSFIGVFSLVWLLPRLQVGRILRQQAGQKEKYRRWGLRLYQFTCGSLLLSLFTAPVVLYHFHRLTPAGLATNLMVVPLVGFLILPAGLLALCFLPISTSLAGFLVTLGSLGLEIAISIATKVSSLSWASLWPGTPRAWQVGLIYVLLLVPFTRTRRWLRASIFVGGSLMLIASLVMPSYLSSDQSFLRVTYLDVSQGSSTVVEFPGGAAMLIDGGGFHGSSFDLGRHVIAPYLWHRGIGSLEAMVLSHAHPDHFKGLLFVATHFPVKQFWYNKVDSEDPDFGELLKSLVQERIVSLGPKDLASPLNIQGVYVQALHPAPDFSPIRKILTDGELNNLSLVLRLEYKNVSFLFTGDIERAAENRLTKLPRLESVDVLLVPHHGSRTSSSMPFLQRLQPRIAVFSVGFNNRFHLPAYKIRKRYDALGVRTYRTDWDGAITVITDGHQIEVETFLNDETP
jgi:competence protein ComEC